MPTNLYGPNDNFDLKSSHVLPAMIRKFHEAKVNGNSPVELWGTGTVFREFLYADDLASAVLHSLNKILDKGIYNVGTGQDISIKELSKLVQTIIGHNGEVFWDDTKPDGTPKKLLDSTHFLSEGWSPITDLKQGIYKSYISYLANAD
jgi:GDP-L-fucose synthase